MSKKAIIIGAGPAGLTAAYEFLTRSNIIPIVLEKSGDIGGISKTINYKGNRMDIGGHRFFSKSDRVMKWWLNILPVETGGESAHTITYQNKSRVVYHEDGGIANDPDKVMLVRPRLSRIYFLRKFFSYPVQLSIDTLMKLGVFRTIGILFSYIKAQIWPNKPELTLEDFMINRFGKVLYGLFFKDYTEKVWGVPCNEIPAEWGAQRIKGVSITKAIEHAIKSLKPKKTSGDVAQKDTETSLIEQFFYPKLGPGQLWEEVATRVQAMGGEILMHQEVIKVEVDGDQAKSITIRNSKTGETQVIEGDYFFSTMPVKELIAAIGEQVPENVQYIARNLQYRDFITVGLLLNNMSSPDKHTGEIKRLELKDTWIYIQERDVKVGRLQIFNNWSPYLVADPHTTWVGMEFFCNETDDFWKLPDEEIKAIAIMELEKIGLATAANVIDGTVLRVEKTYPAYFGAYEHFGEIRTYVDEIKNLYLVGRNGMHKYNNADHSMLTAITAVDNILNGIDDKENIWAINTEQDYHEEKKNDDNIDGGLKEEAVPEVAETSESKKKTELHPLVKFSLYGKGKVWLWAAIASMILCFLGFKFLYPHPDFSNDSYSYIAIAAVNANAGIRPIGYSKFLRLVSVFSTSDLATTGVQYLLIELSAFYLFISLLYWIRMRKIIAVLLFLFLVVNPASLFMANYISADGVFSALSLMWLTNLFWIMLRPGKWDLWISLALLFFILWFRYNALYYPFVATFIFMIAPYGKKRKVLSIVSTFMVTALVYLLVTNTNERKLHVSNFSPFGGWQLANNALQMYAYKTGAHTPMPTVETQKIELITQRYFDTISPRMKYPPLIATDYMWNESGPLRLYWYQYIREHHVKDSMMAWYAIGPVLAEYGGTLIKKYPRDFFKHFIKPNSKGFMNPPLEVFWQYNLGMDSAKLDAKLWFDYKVNKVQSVFDKYQVNLLRPFGVLFGICNVLLLCLAPWGITKLLKSKLPAAFWKIMTGAYCFLLANFLFSVLSAPVVFRYQYFPLLLSFSLCLIMVNAAISGFRFKKISNGVDK